MGENDVDQALVLRVQKGDRRAFDLLVRKYQHKLVSVVGRYINDWSECQDVAQEAFIRAYRAIGAFRGDSQFYTWIYKIAINTAKNYLVSQGRRPPTDDIAVEDAVLFDGSTRLRESATPERELLREEIERTVFATVESFARRVAYCDHAARGRRVELRGNRRSHALPHRNGPLAHLPRARSDR